MKQDCIAQLFMLYAIVKVFCSDCCGDN